MEVEYTNINMVVTVLKTSKYMQILHNVCVSCINTRMNSEEQIWNYLCCIIKGNHIEMTEDYVKKVKKIYSANNTSSL
jgi:hypothetical protein